MPRAPNAQYNLAGPGSLAARVTERQRRRMFQRFLEATGIAPGDSVLDIGVTSDRGYEHSNYLEAWYPEKAAITAIGIDPGAAFLTALHPGLRFAVADGRRLPFADGAFDHVHSSAVLEHVGSRAEQTLFLAEAWRVARKGIFLTTPNRWFPVEFHSQLPLVHWLPPRLFRAILRGLGQSFLAAEANLNLLTPAELRRLARDGKVPHAELGYAWLLGLPTNLLLIARKTPAAPQPASVSKPRSSTVTSRSTAEA